MRTTASVQTLLEDDIMPPELYTIQIAANFLAIVLGPVTAVCITLWVQNRKAARDAKLNVFLVLLAERKGVPFSRRATDAMNTIDVIFHDEPKVVELWHKHFALRQMPVTPEVDRSWLELLTEMARVLRYSNLQQIDLDRCYTPAGHAEQAALQKELMTELLRVLKETKQLAAVPKDGQ